MGCWYVDFTVLFLNRMLIDTSRSTYLPWESARQRGITLCDGAFRQDVQNQVRARS